ncbi:dienelactone hydrolase family protein [Archangium gephyra]|uniref:Beta-lactamase n=1 Tax=Archangium gephyra TaxID=48 RepID=A0AAC8TE13_9BACT|nr:dienelactone hydrolase family protein [Archangium gephyra]AKJ02368.1 Beta-lactamase [Archangium gephyra]REG28705.1 dienelactone hydrolase family protein [Archangium gephyra]
MRSLLLLVLCGTASLAHAASNFTFSNARGDHGVGLRVVHQYDYTRAYKGELDAATGLPTRGERARPIQTVVWYPASKGGTPVVVNDYLRLSATEEVFDRGDAEITAATAKVRVGVLGADALLQETTRPMWAVRDAKPEAGRFPVVIYAPSFNASPTENADLCEFLASQGYVVIASPDMGAHSRAMTEDLEGIETQAADISFLIGYAHTLPQADTRRIAVMGFSWGGMSNVFAAARDSRIKALVSLDGSVRYYPELVEAARYVTPSRVAVPMLYMAAQPPTLEQLIARGKASSVSVLNNLKYSDAYIVTMHPMVHPHFSSAFLRFTPAAAFTDYSQEEVSLAYSWMARYVLQFLNAYLKNDAAGLAFLGNTGVKNGAPPHMISVDARRSTGAPPTQETLAAELARRGFEHAHDAYQALRKRDPQFELSESRINSWGYDLLRKHKNPKAAIEIFKLNTLLHPESSNTFDSLAEAYEVNKDTELAIKAYQHVLTLEPTHANAAQRVKVLGRTGSN